MKISIFLPVFFLLVGCDPTWRILAPDYPHEWVAANGRKTAVANLTLERISLDFAGQLTYGGIFPTDGDFYVRVTNNQEDSLEISKSRIHVSIDGTLIQNAIPKLFKNTNPRAPLSSGRIVKDLVPFEDLIVKPGETVLMLLMFLDLPSVPKTSVAVILDGLDTDEKGEPAPLELRFRM